MPDGSATAHTYRPKLATVLAEGYNLRHFRKDMLAASRFLTRAGRDSGVSALMLRWFFV